MRKEKVVIIAEAGVNHNGDRKLAKRLIDEAARAGADFIKFQTFNAAALATSTAGKADYQKKNTGDKKDGQLEMLKRLELSHEDHVELIAHAQLRKIQFLSTPFDDDSIRLLKKLKIQIGKIPSGEITSLPFLEQMAATFKNIILSTGMSTIKEVSDALKVLYDNRIKKSNIILLHCTTEYPAPFSDVNLKAMLTLKEKFGVRVGYSDHTNGIEVPVAAVAMGAVLIEKHFTLDKAMSGPDHRASLEPKELRDMVKAIRNVEEALGSAEKTPASGEKRNIPVARKSIVARRMIQKGEVFSEENLTIKRPGIGISPMLWHKVLGKKAKRDFSADDFIQL